MRHVIVASHFETTSANTPATRRRSRLMTEIEAARMQERVADALGTLGSLSPRDVVPTY